jgi:hypothetical protein
LIIWVDHASTAEACILFNVPLCDDITSTTVKSSSSGEVPNLRNCFQLVFEKFWSLRGTKSTELVTMVGRTVLSVLFPSNSVGWWWTGGVKWTCKLPSVWIGWNRNDGTLFSIFY